MSYREGFIMRYIYIAALVALIPLPFEADAQQSAFEKYKQQQKKAFDTYKSDYRKRFEAYRENIRKNWGVPELSCDTEYVHYSADQKVQVIANFEDDVIEVNVQETEGETEEQTNKKVQEAILTALNSTPKSIVKTNPEFVIAQSTKKQKQEPANETLKSLAKSNALKANSNKVIEKGSVLSHLGVSSKQQLEKVVSNLKVVPQQEHKKEVVARTEKRLTKQIEKLENIATSDVDDKTKKHAKDMVASLEQEKKSLAKDAEALTKKNIKTYKVSLKRDRYRKAEQYLNYVKDNSAKWQVPESLILAVMETESHFNPVAKSHIPAYGLMQIVPTTAGADVNSKRLKRSGKPTPDLLYQGGENIVYGTAYLNILMTQYLKEVTNPESRMLCAIAAYNTGIGNLARAFNQGKRGRLQAINKINEMSPQEVKAVIQKRTHQETQRYIDKVLASQSYFVKVGA